jgi:peptide-methionine (S)-S-oxide reductase
MNLLLVAALFVTDTATFAGGCFWSMEHAFDQLDGVVSVTVGYAGGREANPTYQQVSMGATGHLESVQVVYDRRKVGYERLLDAFWHNIDPTQADGQFCDHGPQYHTAVFYRDSTQQRAAEASKRRLEARFAQPIVTAITPAGRFYPAEEYHQHYYRKNPIGYQAYRWGCGRDRRLKEVWGSDAPGAGAGAEAQR